MRKEKAPALRTKLISQIRVTEREYELIHRYAIKAGLTLSDFMRASALGDLVGKKPKAVKQ